MLKYKVVVSSKTSEAFSVRLRIWMWSTKRGSSESWILHCSSKFSSWYYKHRIFYLHWLHLPCSSLQQFQRDKAFLIPSHLFFMLPLMKVAPPMLFSLPPLMSVALLQLFSLLPLKSVYAVASIFFCTQFVHGFAWEHIICLFVWKGRAWYFEWALS